VAFLVFDHWPSALAQRSSLDTAAHQPDVPASACHSHKDMVSELDMPQQMEVELHVLLYAQKAHQDQ